MAVGRLPVRNNLQRILTPELWQEIARKHNGHHSPKAYLNHLVVETTKA